jgi:hypothetical protein
MSEGASSAQQRVEVSEIREDLACVAVRGMFTHVQVAPMIDAITVIATNPKYRGLIIDCTLLEGIEPGVGGRVIAQCVANQLRVDHTVIVSRSSAIRALANAAAVLLKDRRVEWTQTRAEAIARIAATTPPRGTPRQRQLSGEQRKPSDDVLERRKRNAG